MAAAAGVDNREYFVYQAKLAEQAERFEEMCEYIKKVAALSGPMKDEERNLLSVAYKNAVGTRRTSWRVLSSIEQRENTRRNEQKGDQVKAYRNAVEIELKNICEEVLDLVDKELLPKATDDEAKVFFHKMKGDYNRYIAEFSEGPKRDEVAARADECYQEATRVAEHLKCTHPIRLGLALNYSVFFYEIANKAERACQMAQEAFNAALAELDSVEEDEYRDSTLILQLLRDNMALWQVKDTEVDAAGDANVADVAKDTAPAPEAPVADGAETKEPVAA